MYKRQILPQIVSSLVDRRLDVLSAVVAPRWYVEPEERFAPPVEVRLESRFPSRVVDRLREMGHPVTEIEAFSRLIGPCHAIELVDGGPSRMDGSLAAVTDPRSAGLPAVR